MNDTTPSFTKRYGTLSASLGLLFLAIVALYRSNEIGFFGSISSALLFFMSGFLLAIYISNKK